LLDQGSFLHGGCWNAIGSYRAVYGSTVDTVAVAESRATADYVGVPLPFRTPRLLVAIDLSLQAVLDLTNVGVRAQLDLTLDSLREEVGARCMNRDARVLPRRLVERSFPVPAKVWWFRRRAFQRE